jgi:hypothetical protein
MDAAPVLLVVASEPPTKGPFLVAGHEQVAHDGRLARVHHERG